MDALKFCTDKLIMVKGMPVCPGVAITEGFVSPYTAAAVCLMTEAGHEYAGQTLDPCGSVLSGECGAALCCDVRGIIRNEADKKGLVYLQPSYGTVSRRGLVAQMASADQTGVAAKDAQTAFGVLKIISTRDDGDGCMAPLAEAESQSEINIFEAEIPFEKFLPAVFEILYCAETAGNVSRFDGLKFGSRANNTAGLNDLYARSRGELLCEEWQLASAAGALVLSKDFFDRFYRKAMCVRRLFFDAVDEMFAANKNAVLRLPAAYKNAHTVTALAGVPSLFLPGGIRLAAPRYKDEWLLKASKKF
ncbi:MAG: amidase family protein [Defluviitaleaceae bacterium]|nr:amidase family protein [Defluviitaleaceae bacterium]